MLKREKGKEEKETKLKLLAGIMVTLLLVTVVFYAFPTATAYTDPPIRIGIPGPMFWPHGQGMVRGATLAADRLNALGGIAGHEVLLYSATTHPNAGTDPDTLGGTLAAEQLIADDNVDFLIGSFRTEAARGIRAVAMDNHIIFFISGSGTNSLIDDGTGVDPDTVRSNYARYKYIFRVTPSNDTALGAAIFGFLGKMIASLVMKYGVFLKLGVIAEAAEWTVAMYGYFTSEIFWNYVVFGGTPLEGVAVDVVESACARVSPVDPGWVPGAVATIASEDVTLVIPILAGVTGRPFVREWGTVKPNATLVGIDVPGQEVPTHWTLTDGGKCEYETFLMTSGGGPGPDEGIPVNTEGPVTTQDFYRDYYTAHGVSPMYTAYGAFDALTGLAESIEDWVDQYGQFTGPLHDDPDYDKLIPIIEQTNRHALTGWFKFTGPNPGNNGDFTDYDPATAGNQPYPYLTENPTMMGTLHDQWTVDTGATWPTGYVRAHQGSWQAGRLEDVWPADQPYSKIWVIPRWMIPTEYHTDVNQDVQRNIADISTVAYATGMSPGGKYWQFAADYDGNGVIDGGDLIPVAADYGKPIIPMSYP